MSGIYPNGLKGRRCLDCACNAGAFCFFSRELDAEYSLGFDVREHWINKAKFVQQHRTVAPTDRIDSEVMNLFDISNRNSEPFDLTIFSGIFYHLPDPIHGTKLAADLTTDILIVKTAALYKAENPKGLTPVSRHSSESDMSGVYNMAWLPNGPDTLNMILQWLGFKEIKLVRRIRKDNNRERLEIIAARNEGRLSCLPGELLE